jgi:hypothetical protein
MYQGGNRGLQDSRSIIDLRMVSGFNMRDKHQSQSDCMG